jgi:hypothetical protein
MICGSLRRTRHGCSWIRPPAGARPYRSGEQGVKEGSSVRSSDGEKNVARLLMVGGGSQEQRQMRRPLSGRETCEMAN